MNIQEAQAFICNLMGTTAVQNINFRLGGVSVYRQGFTQVASLIEQGHINLSTNQAAAVLGAAVYGHAVGPNRVNQLTVPNVNLQNPLGCSLIVHECVHALEDYHRTSLTFLDSEAAAYLAQMLYLNQIFDGAFPPAYEDLPRDIYGIMFEAYMLATQVQRGESIPAEAAAGLHNAIRNSSQYGGIADNLVEYDGVDHSRLRSQ